MKIELRLPTGSNLELAAMRKAIASTAPEPDFVQWSLELIEKQVRRDSDQKPTGFYPQLRRNAVNRKVLSTYSRCVYTRDHEGAVQFSGYFSAVLCESNSAQFIIESVSLKQFWERTMAVEDAAPTDQDLIKDGSYTVFITHCFWSSSGDGFDFVEYATKQVLRWFRGYRIEAVLWSAFKKYDSVVSVVKAKWGDRVQGISSYEVARGSDITAVGPPADEAKFFVYQAKPFGNSLVNRIAEIKHQAYREVYGQHQKARQVFVIGAPQCAELYPRCFQARVWLDTAWDKEFASQLLGWNDPKSTWEFENYWKSVIDQLGHITSPSNNQDLSVYLAHTLTHNPALLIPAAYRAQELV